jgi:hypothetical protein
MPVRADLAGVTGVQPTIDEGFRGGFGVPEIAIDDGFP